MDERLLAGRHHLSNGDRAYHRGHLEESRSQLEAALLQFRGPELRLGEAHALRGLSQLELGCGNLGLAEDAGRSALACYAALREQLRYLPTDAVHADLGRDSDAGEATTRVLLADLFTRAGRLAEAAEMLASVGAALENLSGSALGAVQAAQGRLALRDGDPAGARWQLTQALESYRGVRDGIGEASVSVALGELDRLEGDVLLAEQRLSHGLALARQIAHPAIQGRALVAWAGLRLQQRRLPEARAAYLEALPLIRTSGDSEIEGFALLGLGEILSRAGDPAAGATLVEGARVVGRLGHVHGLAGALVRLSQHALEVNDPELALAAAESARRLYSGNDPIQGVGHALRVTVKALAGLREWPATVAAAHWRSRVAGHVQLNAVEVQAFYRARAPAAWLAEIDRWAPDEVAPRALRMVDDSLAPILADLSLDPTSLGTVGGALAVVGAFARGVLPPQPAPIDPDADLDELPTDALEEIPPEDPPEVPIAGESFASPARRRSVLTPMIAPPRGQRPPGEETR